MCIPGNRMRLLLATCRRMRAGLSVQEVPVVEVLITGIADLFTVVRHIFAESVASAVTTASVLQLVLDAVAVHVAHGSHGGNAAHHHGGAECQRDPHLRNHLPQTSLSTGAPVCDASKTGVLISGLWYKNQKLAQSSMDQAGTSSASVFLRASLHAIHSEEY